MYLVLDSQILGYEALLKTAEEAIASGVDIIQLRDKTASAGNMIQVAQQIARLAKGKIPFIVNDRVDVALAVGADGVHLGQEDLPLRQARQMMGEEAIIGISCQTLEHAQQAQQEGADYIGFGSVYKTKTKPVRRPMELKLLKDVVEKIQIPVFAIGGIDHENIPPLIRLGIERVAVTRSILMVADVRQATRKLKEAVTEKALKRE